MSDYELTSGKLTAGNNSKLIKYTINISTVIGLAACVLFIVYGIDQHIFTSEEALNAFLTKLGIFAPIAFILVQAIQVVIPIIPGSIGCLGGVIFFGPVLGFIFNYVGICLGSFAAFLLARRFGKPIVTGIASKKNWNKYSGWLNSEKYDRLFAFAIIFPVAPDDFLCYLSGLTDMKFRRYMLIILACKPFSIAIYTFLLGFIFEMAMKLFG